MALATNALSIQECSSSTTSFCSTKNCLLSYLNESQRMALPKGIHQPKILHKGEILTVQGAKAWSFYQVRSGSFKSYFNDINGNCYITGFHFSGDLVGLDALQSGHHAYQIKALETSSVCGLSLEQINRVLNPDAGDFYRGLMTALSSLECRRYESLLMITRMRAEQRLAYFILDVSRRMQAVGVSGTEFDLSMARYDIANYLGVAVETLSRLFKRFQQERLIEVRRQHLVIMNMKALESVVANESACSEIQRSA